MSERPPLDPRIVLLAIAGTVCLASFAWGAVDLGRKLLRAAAGEDGIPIAARVAAKLEAGDRYFIVTEPTAELSDPNAKAAWDGATSASSSLAAALAPSDTEGRVLEAMERAEWERFAVEQPVTVCIASGRARIARPVQLDVGRFVTFGVFGGVGCLCWILAIARRVRQVQYA